VENLAGVRRGDRLFVVKSDVGYLHGGYIFYKTRQTRILGETGSPPLIGCCWTAPFAQGRGLYRKALGAELSYLQDQGYSRALIETSPQNIPSRKGIEAAGFRLCREMSAWIMLNRLVCQKAVEPSGTKWRIILC
jgi:RimJ/RimL family protein N-acetyltransferase